MPEVVEPSVALFVGTLSDTLGALELLVMQLSPVPVGMHVASDVRIAWSTSTPELVPIKVRV